jgi:hypothetical protein
MIDAFSEFAMWLLVDEDLNRSEQRKQRRENKTLLGTSFPLFAPVSFFECIDGNPSQILRTSSNAVTQ